MPLHVTKRMNKKIHKLNWLDISVLKIDIIAFALLLAALFPVLTSAHRGWYVAVIVVCEIYLSRALFGRKKHK